eukprot:6466615-Amphidinium_carterae.4
MLRLCPIFAVRDGLFGLAPVYPSASKLREWGPRWLLLTRRAMHMPHSFVGSRTITAEQLATFTLSADGS